jgi:beta-lactamase class C
MLLLSRLYPRLAAALVASTVTLSHAFAVGPDRDARVRQAVDEAMKPIIEQYGIPGLAVAVTIDGRRHFIEYGLASTEPRVPVTRETLFELGSISKTFTATLATYAEVEGKLSLNDGVSQHMPEMKGSALDKVRLLDLATHTAGGFPLQLPGNVKDQKQLIAYYRAWMPKYARGPIAAMPIRASAFSAWSPRAPWAQVSRPLRNADCFLNSGCSEPISMFPRPR